MDVSQFCSATRLLIVAGKGGVGKTTVTAALARMASQAGHPTLIVEVEGKSGIGAVFGRREVLGYEEETLAEHVKARTLTPDDALLEYLADHGMKRISKRLTNSGALDVVSTAVPGIKDILVLGKVKQLERASDDLIVLDAPAAGHAVTFLTSAAGLLDAARVGPIRAQAQDVVDLLSDPERCQVILVTLPEETPVNEVVETAYKLEDRVGIKLGPVVVNGLYPRLDGLDDDPPTGADLTEEQRQALKEAAEFRRSRQDLQAEQVSRLRDELPLPQLHLPFLFTPEVGPDELDVLATTLAEQVGRLLTDASLADLVAHRSIIVCCGSGGVGKTTTAAALALEAARQGRRACVVTIDPAKRLADALGLESLSNAPGRITGDWPGSLYALMLDTKSTFDNLVTMYSATPGQAEAILANRLYRNMAGALSGTQEYMAMEKLYELAAGKDYDLIVIDTPPTRNALDFLDAPRRLTRFLDNRIFKLLMMPTRAYLKAVSVATQTFLRTISRVVGGEVVADAVAFFQAFEGMEQGFRDRAVSVLEMLKATSTGFVLVTSPRRDAVEEAAFFADKLAESGIDVDGLVVNRLHPSFGTAPVPEGLGDLSRNLADFRSIAEREEHHFQQLAGRIAPAPVARVPFLADDVHDLAGLQVVGGHLFGGVTQIPM